LILTGYPGIKSIKDLGSIFKWFSEDFNDDVVGFILKYAQEDLKKQLELQIFKSVHLASGYQKKLAQ